jgi:hypothetical protein
MAPELVKVFVVYMRPSCVGRVTRSPSHAVLWLTCETGKERCWPKEEGCLL